MQKILVFLPDDLAIRMKQMIPARNRSRVIAEMPEAEIQTGNMRCNNAPVMWKRTVR